MKPENIIPYHEVRDEKKVRWLARNMQTNGWVGRPIIAVGNEAQGDCRALTATHRIAAAIVAGLQDVPVYWLEIPTLEDWDRIDQSQEQDDILAAIEVIDPEAAEIYAQEPGII
jgi:hypothetical protein